MILSKESLVMLIFFLAAATALLSVALIGFSYGTSISVAELVEQATRIEIACGPSSEGG